MRFMLTLACISLFLAGQDATARPAPRPPRRPPTGLFPGETITPSQIIQVNRDPAHTLELDDLTPWRVRISIPF